MAAVVVVAVMVQVAQRIRQNADAHRTTQVAHPGWWSAHDQDPQLGAAARRLLLWRAAQDGWRLGVPHFARPFGSVGPKGWLE